MSFLNLPLGTQLAPEAAGVSTAPEPFVWGEAGTKLTPAQVLAQQEQGAKLSQPDYSPVSSIYQGLGRVFDNLHGALETRSANKAAAALQVQGSAVARALLSGDKNAIGAAYASGNPSLVDLGGKVYDAAHPKALAPHYWETNDGSLGMVGADGQPHIAYKDPTPKVTTIAVDNGDGTKTLYRVGPDGVPIGAGLPGAAPAPTASTVPAVGTIEDGHRFMGGDPSAESSWQPVAAAGGAAPRGTATFR